MALEKEIGSPVEGNADLRQENLKVLARKVFLCRVTNSLEYLAARFARLGVVTRERKVVVPWLEVVLFLLR